MSKSLGVYPISAVTIGNDLVASLPGNVYGYKINRLSITGPVGSTAVAYVGSPTIGQFDYTIQGYGDSSEYPTPVDVPPGTVAYVVWAGQAGRTAQATFSLSSRD